MKFLENSISFYGRKILVQGGNSTFDLLDYGCGKGFDADYYGLDRYDPHYFPELDRSKQYDYIFCNYVLNVVDEKTECDIILDIHSLLKPTGKAYFAVRRDMPITGRIMNGYRQRYCSPGSNPYLVGLNRSRWLQSWYRKHMQFQIYEHYKRTWLPRDFIAATVVEVGPNTLGLSNTQTITPSSVHGFVEGDVITITGL